MWRETLKRAFVHKVSKDEIILKVCPYCENARFNFQVSTSKEIFHCWVCGARGKIEHRSLFMVYSFQIDHVPKP